MSLNSVVNNLVRAAAGIPSDISDKDLDRHVAELLAAEAKRKEIKWSELGLGALLGRERDSPDPSLPKPNKRFLSSIIKNVDGHNTALLRAQAEAARAARHERLGESSSSRSGSSRMGGNGADRLFGGAMRGLGNGRDTDREMGREDRRSSRDGWERDRMEDRERHRSGRYGDDERDRAWERESAKHSHSTAGKGKERERDSGHPRGVREHNRYHRSRNGEDDERRSECFRERGHDDHRKRYAKVEDAEDRHEREGERHRDRQWDLDREGDPSTSTHKEKTASRHHHPRHLEGDGEGGLSSPNKDNRRDISKGDPKPHRSTDRIKNRTPSPSSKTQSTPHPKSPANNKQFLFDNTSKSEIPSPPPPPPSAPPPLLPPGTPPPKVSKMDKYFSKAYDPRLDYGEIPKEGLIADVGWDNMLAVLKEKGKKRRRQSPSLSEDLAPPPLRARAFSPDLPTSSSSKYKTKKKSTTSSSSAEKRKKRLQMDDSDFSDEERERKLRKEKRKAEKRRETDLNFSSGGGGGGLGSAGMGATSGNAETMFAMEYTRKGGVREWDKGK